MVDLSEFYNANPKYCALIIKTVGLTEEDQEKLQGALDETNITNKAIMRWLRSRNISVSDTTIARHRAKTCPCA